MEININNINKIKLLNDYLWRGRVLNKLFIRREFFPKNVHLTIQFGQSSKILDFHLTKDLKYDELGSKDFCVDEFRPPLTIEKLCSVINNENYTITLNEPNNTVNRLNELLMIPDFYDILQAKKPGMNFPNNKKITELVDKTENYRHKCFSSLINDEQSNIKGLNRLLLEETYPKETPRCQKLYITLYNISHADLEQIVKNLFCWFFNSIRKLNLFEEVDLETLRQQGYYFIPIEIEDKQRDSVLIEACRPTISPAIKNKKQGYEVNINEAIVEQIVNKVFSDMEDSNSYLKWLKDNTYDLGDPNVLVKINGSGGILFRDQESAMLTSIQVNSNTFKYYWLTAKKWEEGLPHILKKLKSDPLIKKIIQQWRDANKRIREASSQGDLSDIRPIKIIPRCRSSALDKL